MKSERISTRATSQAVARLNKQAKGSSQGKVLEDLLFLGEKIQAVKNKQMSIEALLTFLNFQYDIDISEIVKKIEYYNWFWEEKANV